MHLPTGTWAHVLLNAQDASEAAAPYDSIWAANGASGASSAFEQVMLSNDKLYVVLGVVLIIWIGLIFLLVRNDRRLASLERTARENIPHEDPLGPVSATGSAAGPPADAPPPTRTTQD